MTSLLKMGLAMGCCLSAMMTPSVGAAHLPPPTPAPSANMPLPTASRTQQYLVRWVPGQVTCAGERQRAAVVIRSPQSQSQVLAQRHLTPVTLTFSIDEGGRPLSIAREGVRSPIWNDDLGPSLAASQFSAGTAATNCRITYTPETQTFAEASTADIAAFSMNTRQSRPPREAWARVWQTGNCRDDPPQRPLTRAYPDFATIEKTPGEREWTLVEYDTDAQGAPVNPHVVFGTGSAALNAASVTAVQSSRFTGGARTGCRYSYWNGPAAIAAPEAPDIEDYRPAGGNCPAGTAWAVAPVLRFPTAYQRRMIEGWAIVTYDIAAGGQVGNIQVAAAQPAQEFGQAAVNILRSARTEPLAKGVTGCVERVVFRMSPAGVQPNVDESGNPLG